MNISIIVPVYNTARYLDECINSILNQEYEKFELILINDGSEDESGLICNGYANKYSNVSVYHTENKGVSNARNIGINKAKYNYIMFIDSDDYIEYDTLDIISKSIGSSDMLVVNQVKDYYKNGKLIRSEKESETKQHVILPNINEELEYIFKYIKMDSACGKVYRKDILIKNNIYFNSDINIREDSIFNIEYLNYTLNIKMINDQLYHFRINDDVNYLIKRKPKIINCDVYSISIKKMLNTYKVDDLDTVKYFNNLIFNFYYIACIYFFMGESNSSKGDRQRIIIEIAESKQFKELIKQYTPRPMFLRMIMICFRYKAYKVLNLLLLIRYFIHRKEI